MGLECTTWEALYATMAHPDFFKGIDIGEHPFQQSFVGGEVGCSNPMTHVLAEVKQIYPDRHVSCILNIGAGHTRTIHIPNPDPTRRILRLEVVVAMKHMATNSERVAEDMAARFQGTGQVYFRFNMDQGTQSAELDDWEKLNQVVAHTLTYISKVEVNDRMDKAARALKERKCKIATRLIGQFPHLNFILDMLTRAETVLVDGHIPSVGCTVVVKRCPVPTAVFTGREDDIKIVKTCIVGGAEERRVYIIHGLGGTGKT
jgi:hypothetical protein